MSLEEECNWILSGREPLMFNDNGFDDDDDEEDNTLDDISGDEVTRLTVGEINIRILRFCVQIMNDFTRNSKPMPELHFLQH